MQRKPTFRLHGIVTLFFFILLSRNYAQVPTQDTIYLMNGHVVSEKVIDTLLGAVTIFNPEKFGQKIHYEWSQLYMVHFATGDKRYYYQQDTTINNWFTRDEMWLF